MEDHLKNISVYLDESGSTGTNYVDDTQQFFIQGGFVIPNSSKARLEEAFKAWKTEYYKDENVEVKGNNHFAKKKGMREFLELWSILKKHILAPSYSIIEKKFFLAVACVETFLDSAYNETVSDDDFFWSRNRPRWANIIYEHISDKTCQHISNVIHRLSFEDLINGKKSLLVDLGSVDKKLIQGIEACNIDEGYSFLSNTNKPDHKNNRDMSPNIQGFLTLFHSLKNEIYTQEIDSVSVFIDHNDEYSVRHKELFEMLTTGKAQKVPVSRDHSVVWGVNEKWEITVCDSKEDNLVQIADIICAYLQCCIGDILNNRDFEFRKNQVHLGFWAPFFTKLLGKEIGVRWYYYGLSETFISKFDRALKFCHEGIKSRNPLPFTNEEQERLASLHGKEKKKYIKILKAKYDR